MKPIHFASIQGSVATLKALTKLGADPRSPTQDNVCVKRMYIHVIEMQQYNYCHIMID